MFDICYKYFCFIFHCFILIEYNFYYLNNLCVVQFVKEIIYLIFWDEKKRGSEAVILEIKILKITVSHLWFTGDLLGVTLLTVTARTLPPLCGMPSKGSGILQHLTKLLFSGKLPIEELCSRFQFQWTGQKVNSLHLF